MPYIHLFQGRVWYAPNIVTSEDSPPLVLIHGAGGSHLDWPGELRRIPVVNTLTFNLPGHGRSDPPGRKRIEDYAEDTLALLDGLEVRRAVLCGHSMGGAVCQTLALDRPDRVAGLVLIATGAKLRVAPDLLAAVKQDPDSAYDIIARRLWPEGKLREQGRERLAQTPPDVLRDDLLACDAFNLMDQVRYIDAPALVIGGTNDPLTPPKFSRYLAKQIPDADLMIVEGAGHMVMLQRPARVSGAVEDFVQRIL